MARTRVAVVATTAETIEEDTHRALDLLGRGARREAESTILFGATPAPGLPGAATKPWQWAAWKRWMLARGQTLPPKVTVSSPGVPASADEFGWLRTEGLGVGRSTPGEGALCESKAALVSVAWRGAPRRRHPHPLRAYVLGSLCASGRWAVRGATAILCDALRAGRPWPTGEADVEAVAELMHLEREDHQPHVILLDATVCGSDSRRLRPMVLDRVIAGTDPVAVDAVGALLLGWQPRSIPWLARLEEEGLGTSDFSQIDVVGGGIEMSTCLAAARIWRPKRRSPRLSALSRLGEWAARAYHALLWRPWVGRPIRRLYERTPWGRLEVDTRATLRSSG